MPRRIDKPTTMEVTNEFNWNEFSEDCVASKYVLVVGSQAILNKEQNHKANGDSTQLLFNDTVDYLRNNGKRDETATNFTQLGRSFQELRQCVIDTIKPLDFKTDFETEIEPTLYKLVATKCFRVIITSAIDPYLEILMEKVWGEGNYNVINIYGKKKDLLESELPSGNNINEIRPTLCYAFGKVDWQRPQQNFVLTENDALSTIPKWFDEGRPKNLLTYINSKGMKIAAVGCKFDDWLFRFFWFVLRGSIDNLRNGQVAVAFHPEHDGNLIQYLAKEHIERFDEARQFMSDALPRITDALKIDKLSREQGEIFISYAHEDKYLAIPLFKQLTDGTGRRFKVWIDEAKLEGAAEFDIDIEHAIYNCKVFVAILSSQVKIDLNNDEIWRYYKNKEWTIAQKCFVERKNLGDNPLRILPVVTGEYNVYESYHQKTPECIKKYTAFDLSKSTIEQLKNKIEVLLNS